MSQINKTIHIVWIGDENKIPEACIETWRIIHPEWQFKIWGNNELKNYPWHNKAHMDAVYETGQLCGVADLMRWEILLNYGGITVDADSICINAIPEWLLNSEFFACYENEFERPGLISNGFVGSLKNNPLLQFLVNNLHEQKNIANYFSWSKLRKVKKSSWKTTGPLAITNAIKTFNYNKATILPSHLSIPIHYKGRIYKGNGLVICSQLFGSTHTSTYDEFNTSKANVLIESVKKQLA